MSSLHKKKLKKENSQRLTNSKILAAYQSSSPLHQKLALPVKRTQRSKQSSRKHISSLQKFVSNKEKEPFSLRSLQFQKDKPKCKKVKKDKNSNQSSRFILPVPDFSGSNSLIVFSEKDSTLDGNFLKHSMPIFLSKQITPTRAATLIQKTWRGYLTRKLLQQYINEEENKLVSVRNKLRSQEDSFFLEHKPQEEANVSSLSSIEQGTLNILQCRQYDLQDEEETNTKHYAVNTTEHESSQFQRESPCAFPSFFKSNRTETDVLSNRKQNEKHSLTVSRQIKGINLDIHSNTVKYSYICKDSSKQNQLQDGVQLLQKYLEKQWICGKYSLKEKLNNCQVNLQEMIRRSTKIKEIYQNSREFIIDVKSQIEAMIEDIKDIIMFGKSSIEQQPKEQKNQPKSQLFTIELSDNQPELPILREPNFSQGQIKLQNYLNDLLEEYQNNEQQMTEVQFLCQVIKSHSERGVNNIAERCLLQFTIEIITQDYPLLELHTLIQTKLNCNNQQHQFLLKWVLELDKWEMGPIQQVTQAMQSSSFITCEAGKSHLFEDQ